MATPSGSSNNTSRRDTLRAIEKKLQADWEQNRVFEAVPKVGEGKYMLTFPIPYMNGSLHLGHAFTFTKADFAAGYHRMKGKEVLLPFAFHVTGTPISACAEKLKKEVEKYGNPPQFPAEEEEVKAPTTSGSSAADQMTSGKFSGKKLKKAPNKPQWLIMRDMGLSDAKISKYQGPNPGPRTGPWSSSHR